MELVISLCCIILAGASKGAADILQHKYKKSIFAAYEKELFYNPKKSWKNKWRPKTEEKGYVEKFPGSSTIFVFTTDAWHLCNFFMYKLIFLVVILQPSFGQFLNPDTDWYLVKALDFSVFHAFFSGSFEVFYSYILLVRPSKKKIQ